MTTYTLNIQQQDPHTQTNSNLSVTTDDAQELMRLLQLSGVSTTSDTMEVIPCDVSGQESAMQAPAMQSVTTMMEQQADYDYGHKDPMDEQDEFTITDYNFRGRADLPERITSARFGSNPLKNDMKEAAFVSLKNKYEQFLEESAQGGQDSPLTADNRPEFLHDPQQDQDAVTDGSHSPLSTIVRDELPE